MIGLRTFKTAVAVSICFALYSLVAPNSQIFGPFYACIGAAISLQPTIDRSKHIAINRVIGTIIGGLYSAVLFSIFVHVGIARIEFLFVFAGIILTIITCNKFGYTSGISTGCIVLIGAFTLDFNTTPLIHAIARTIDTSIGVIIAYYVNVILPGGEVR